MIILKIKIMKIEKNHSKKTILPQLFKLKNQVLW